MRGPLCQRQLHAVVIGHVVVRYPIDIAQVWKSLREWPCGLCCGRIRAAIAITLCGTRKTLPRRTRRNRWISPARAETANELRLIDVGQSDQFSSMISNVCNIHGQVGRKRMLEIKVPFSDIRRSQV